MKIIGIFFYNSPQKYEFISVFGPTNTEKLTKLVHSTCSLTEKILEIEIFFLNTQVHTISILLRILLYVFYKLPPPYTHVH